MNSEIYTAAQGLVSRQIQLDAISNNIANSSTNGFREVSPFFKAYNRALDNGPLNPMNNAANNQPVAAGVFFHSKQGPIKETGNPLDVAIEGEGYFKLNTPFGQRYTRNGHFTIDVRGTLVTEQGYQVLDTQDRPITLGTNRTDVSVSSLGAVTQDGSQVGQLKLVTFANKNDLIPEEDNLLVMQNPTSGEIAADGRLSGGFIETSNVNLAKQMIDMINAQRAYELNVRSVRTIDTNFNEGVMRAFAPR